jgi:hypothetical protein
MDLGSIRDWVLIVVGIVYSFVFLTFLIITLVLGHFMSDYLGKGHEAMTGRVRPLVDHLQEQAEQLRLRTLTLPGQPALPGSESVRASLPTTSNLRPLSLRMPSFRRRKPWWQRMLPK